MKNRTHQNKSEKMERVPSPEGDEQFEAWRVDEVSPDGLVGTPSERFLQAITRIVSADKTEVDRAFANKQTLRQKIPKND